MPEFNYPPQRSFRLGTELKEATDRVAERESRVDDLRESEDVDQDSVREAENDLDSAEHSQKALNWAVHGDSEDDGFDGWGEDAVIVVEAHTRDSRSRALDTMRKKTMGTPGAEKTQDWLMAARIDDAPWLSGGEELEERQRLFGSLHPKFSDWLAEKITNLTALDSGN